ncbi:MAG: DUF2207 domain-containing protein, partial [Clostridiales bacterium]|nr:DUF2207 domain-containing protein [Clostridiales bacterium]
MRKISSFFKFAGVCLIFLVILSLLFVVPVFANSINKVEIWVNILSDGSATVKEVWDIDVTNASNTEWYVAKHNLDNMDILDLLMVENKSDSSIVSFETLSAWDENASRSEKAWKCGLLKADGGYDICWGFGELGHHKYTLTYKITNIVKGYQGGDAMSFKFLSEADGGAGSLNIYLKAKDFAFENPETRVWVFGYNATSSFVGGGISVVGNGRFLQDDYAVIMLVFNTGLLSPSDQRSETIGQIMDLNLKGSALADGNSPTPTPTPTPTATPMPTPVRSSSGFNFLHIIMNRQFVSLLILLLILKLMPCLKINDLKAEILPLLSHYSKVPYCRELPFDGDVGAAYVRLRDIGYAKESSIVGCFLLKWIRTGQIEIVSASDGISGNREKTAIQLYAAEPDLPLLEAKVYRMITTASGRDGVVRNKDFRRWAKKNYGDIIRWLKAYYDYNKDELVRMGVYEVVHDKRMFGRGSVTFFHDTPITQDITLKALGFRRYLVDFASFNEHEAQKVELWGQYLAFAQLFGIANRVAAQFKDLYPSRFVQNNLEYDDNFMAAAAISHSFSNSMQQGFNLARIASVGGWDGDSGSGGGSSGGGAQEGVKGFSNMTKAKYIIQKILAIGLALGLLAAYSLLAPDKGLPDLAVGTWVGNGANPGDGHR